MVEWLLNIFYPHKCMFCGEPINNKEYYCNKCYYKLPFVEDCRCVVCGREISARETICLPCRTHKRNFDENHPVFLYKDEMESALKRYKFTGKMYYYKPFSKFIFDEVQDILGNIDYIVYPPVNRKTFYKRGYNQCELIARELSALSGVPYLKNVIKKLRQYNKQSLVKGKDRYKNVRGAFAIRSKYHDILKDKRILLIDDVLTTGATLDECSRMLKKHGAFSVICTTLCIVR